MYVLLCCLLYVACCARTKYTIGDLCAYCTAVRVACRGSYHVGRKFHALYAKYTCSEIWFFESGVVAAVDSTKRSPCGLQTSSAVTSSLLPSAARKEALVLLQTSSAARSFAGSSTCASLLPCCPPAFYISAAVGGRTNFVAVARCRRMKQRRYFKLRRAKWRAGVLLVLKGWRRKLSIATEVSFIFFYNTSVVFVQPANTSGIFCSRGGLLLYIYALQ